MRFMLNVYLYKYLMLVRRSVINMQIPTWSFFFLLSVLFLLRFSLFLSLSYINGSAFYFPLLVIEDAAAHITNNDDK